jgi:hypothetical protein
MAQFATQIGPHSPAWQQHFFVVGFHHVDNPWAKNWELGSGDGDFHHSLLTSTAA